MAEDTEGTLASISTSKLIHIEIELENNRAQNKQPKVNAKKVEDKNGEFLKAFW